MSAPLSPTFVLKRLDSGYWHLRQSPEVWAQWRVGYLLTADDCFHSSFTVNTLMTEYRRLFPDGYNLALEAE